MRIGIRIEGISPLLCNKFTDEAAMAASEGSRGSSAAQERGTPYEIAYSKIYRDEDGVIGIPSPNLMRCLVDGGQFHKIGRKQVTTSKSSLLYGALMIEPAMIPLVYRDPWTVDTRPVRIPSTGGRILTHRPSFDDWKLEFEADLDTTILGPKLFRQIVDDAGKRIGLGDFRPGTKGPFGRFVVTHWAVLVVPEDVPEPELAAVAD